MGISKLISEGILGSLVSSNLILTIRLSLERKNCNEEAQVKNLTSSYGDWIATFFFLAPNPLASAPYG